MLPASKHSNPVIGIDTHMVMLPLLPAPVPMPHPFIGFMLDPMDYIPFLGTQVHINGAKRANAGTVATLAIQIHTPLGAGFHPTFMPRIHNEGFHFYGSKTVTVDKSYFSGATHMLMTCSCLGIPLGGYLPTSNSIPLPTGKPVFVGGPQVTDLKSLATNTAIAGRLSFLMKRIQKPFQKLKAKSWLKGDIDKDSVNLSTNNTNEKQEKDKNSQKTKQEITEANFVKGWWADKNGSKIKETRIGDVVRFYIETKNLKNESIALTLKDWDGQLNIDDTLKGAPKSIYVKNNLEYIEFTIPKKWQDDIEDDYGDEIELYFEVQYKGKTYELPKSTDDYLKVFKKTKVILVFYHGGPFGSGQIKRKSNDDTGHTGVIYDKIYSFIKSKNIEVIGAIIAPAITQELGVRTGKRFIADNYYPGDEIIIYGYSYGGDNAVNLSEAISQKVDTMIIVDSSDGPLRQITVDRSIPENVEYALNIYQRKASGGFSRSGKDSDDPDTSEESTSDGSSNTMGSRGFPHHAEGDNIVENIDVTAYDTTHGTIQQRNEDVILNKLKSRINSYEHK